MGITNFSEEITNMFRQMFEESNDCLDAGDIDDFLMHVFLNLLYT